MAIIIFAISALLVGVDQLTKYLVVQNVAPLQDGAVRGIKVIDGLLNITYLENKGVALGMLQNQHWIFIPLTLIGILVLIIALFKYKNHNFWSYATVTLLIAGGIGNLIDRIALGYVVDFIHVSFFPYVFNFADCCVTVGAITLVLAVLFSEKKKDDDVAEGPVMSEEIAGESKENI